jgi:phosphopantothenoylcysteine decarboxylase
MKKSKASATIIRPKAKKPRVVLGVTASIAAFRAADLASALSKAGVDVDVILTREACRFITPLTFAALTHRQVVTDANEGVLDARPMHITLADDADLVIVAPATANLIGEYAHGLAPEVLTCILLATLAPVVVAPAMNGKMWLHPATQANVELLKKRGVEFIGPEKGLLACGYEGIGRLWPVADIARQVLAKFGISSEKK